MDMLVYKYDRKSEHHQWVWVGSYNSILKMNESSYCDNGNNKLKRRNSNYAQHTIHNTTSLPMPDIHNDLQPL
jgi:hypothetical protein